MISNPYDMPPLLPGNEQAQAWGWGFLFGLSGPLYSTEQAPESIAQELLQPFEEGVLAGQQSAIYGLDIFPPYIDTEEGEHVPLSAELGLEGVSFVGELLQGAKLATAAFSTIFMVALDIALAAHHYTPPEQVIDGLNRDFFKVIEALGREDCAFFVGGGIDFSQRGAQLQLTPLYRTQELAHAAATGLGRALWFVGEWHANQCGTMTIVEGATE
jgi:hypothetical protein